MISREYLFSSIVIVDEVFIVVIVMVFSDTLDHFRFCISEKRKDVKNPEESPHDEFNARIFHVLLLSQKCHEVV